MTPRLWYNVKIQCINALERTLRLAFLHQQRNMPTDKSFTEELYDRYVSVPSTNVLPNGMTALEHFRTKAGQYLCRLATEIEDESETPTSETLMATDTTCHPVEQEAARVNANHHENARSVPRSRHLAPDSAPVLATEPSAEPSTTDSAQGWPSLLHPKATSSQQKSQQAQGGEHSRHIITPSDHHFPRKGSHP